MDETVAIHEKKNAARLSVIAAIFLTVIKLSVGLQTNSLGVLAEALHSTLDLMASLVTLIAVRIAAVPADKQHTYGHGKVESVAALIQTFFLLLACAWIVYEAVSRLASGNAHAQPNIWAIGVLAVAITVDFFRARHLRHVAKKYKSQVLEADALHFSTDMLSSSMVILGLVLVWAAQFASEGFWAHNILIRGDSLAALFVAVIVASVALRLAKRAANTLIDSVNPECLAEVEKAVLTVEGVLRISRLRVRESGAEYFVDMTIVLPSDYTLQKAHGISEYIEQKVRDIVPKADVTVHYEPER